jgi:hypothetical protein
MNTAHARLLGNVHFWTRFQAVWCEWWRAGTNSTVHGFSARRSSTGTVSVAQSVYRLHSCTNAAGTSVFVIVLSADASRRPSVMHQSWMRASAASSISSRDASAACTCKLDAKMSNARAGTTPPNLSLSTRVHSSSTSSYVTYPMWLSLHSSAY